MQNDIDRRRTVRLRRSALVECKLGEMDRPAVKIAETTDEYYKAFRLLYDEYHRAGYTQRHPSAMLYSLWSLLSTTNVFIFKSHLEVASTMSHIMDSEPFGLPMDQVYKDHLDDLRAQGRKIAELGALATQQKRRWSNLMIFLYRAAMHFAKYSGVTDLVLMVNPKHVRFYKQILFCEPFGEERLYEKVGAPAVPLRVDMGTLELNLFNAYAENDFDTNLYTFFTKFSDPLVPGEEMLSGRRRRQMGPYTVHFLLQQRPEILKNLTAPQSACLNGLYHLESFTHTEPVEGGEAFRKAVAPTLKQLQLENMADYADCAFSRNLGLIDYAGQQKLLQTRIAIPGMGGVGGGHLITLVRTGFGAFNLADFDRYSPVNINRQYGADLGSFGRAKLDVMVERALSINPFLDVRCFPEGISDATIDSFLENVDILVDSLDFFSQGIRRALFNRALEKNIPVITAGPMGHSCALLLFMPGGMNYDAYFGVTDSTSKNEQLIRFALGLSPKASHLRYMDRRFVNLREGIGPSLNSACQICSGIVATEAVKLALGKKPMAVVPRSCQFDPYRGTLCKPLLRWGVNSRWQRFKVAVAQKLLFQPPRLGAEPVAKPEIPTAGTLICPESLRYIIRAGIQAPSGDNMQPWLFRPGKDHIDVLIRRGADSSFFNVEQTATLLSGGAAVQNMVYAAAALGIRSATRLFPRSGDKDLVATLRFSPHGAPAQEALEAALWRRCTNRRLYTRRPVPVAVWERLATLADEDEDALLLYRSDPAGLRQLGRAVYRADIVRVERQDLHEHLMELIHFEQRPGETEGEYLPHRTGMPLKNLQAGFLGELYLRGVRSWRAMRWANRLGLGKMMPLYSALSMYRSGGAGLLCARGGGEAAVLKAGRALQRVWCALEHFGFAVQPMAALTLLHLRLNREGERVFSPPHARLLREAWELAAPLFPVPSDAVPLLLFRAGQCGAIKHGTYRQEVEDMLAATDESAPAAEEPPVDLAGTERTG